MRTVQLVTRVVSIASEVEREIQEGAFHAGKSATVQVVGVKRAT